VTGRLRQFGALLKLLILTGCRRNEIADLQWSEVDGVAFTIPGTRTKNKKAHTVALTPMVKAVLASLPCEEDQKFVLRRPGYPDRGFSGFSKRRPRSETACPIGSCMICAVHSRRGCNASRCCRTSSSGASITCREASRGLTNATRCGPKSKRRLKSGARTSRHYLRSR
jgi:hypothetical protein